MSNKEIKYIRPITATICVILGIILGIYLANAYIKIIEAGDIALPFTNTSLGSQTLSDAQKYMFGILFSIVFAFLGFIFEGFLARFGKLNTSDKVIYLSGLILGIMISAAFRLALGGVTMPLWVSVIITVILTAISIYALKSIMEQWSFVGKNSAGKMKFNKIETLKFLDTNVIIDGRIADVCKTGFVEGEVVVPKFILMELQLISDSSDPLKRARGRRGLEILNNLQQEFDLAIRETPVDDMKLDVDSKLVTAAIDAGATIVTNDYNLNKVASLQDVKVLNINELANSLKPIVLPGENMKIAIMKEGKEKNQGIAYLDDGTMIVVEGAGFMMGETCMIEVTSVLQTAQGKMIFAKLKEMDSNGNDESKRSNSSSRRK